MNNKIHLNKIVLASDITGMIMAPILGAIFIPVAYCRPYGWEYDQDLDISLIQTFRKVNKKNLLFPHRYENTYFITENDEKKNINCFYWEIEELYKYLLTNTSMIYENFQIKTVNNFIKNQMNFNTRYGTELIVTFDKCWIINPNDSWFNTNLECERKTVSETCHFIDHLSLKKETDDMKGVTYYNDIELINNNYYDKVWHSNPFGPKKFLLGYNPKAKCHTVSSMNLTFIKQNINKEDLEEEVHSLSESRKCIYKYLSKYYKRIAERYSHFDKNIGRMIISTNLNFYKDDDSINFIYYDDIKEIICQKNVNYNNWSHSYLQHLYQTTDLITNSTFSIQSTKKSQ
jgi:hypothetical protein